MIFAKLNTIKRIVYKIFKKMKNKNIKIKKRVSIIPHFFYKIISLIKIEWLRILIWKLPPLNLKLDLPMSVKWVNYFFPVIITIY